MAISKEAKDAILRGVSKGDTIVKLQLLGVSLRVINILEESEFQIIKLEDLLSKSRQEISSIPNMAEKSVKKIYKALSRYDEIERIEKLDEFNGEVKKVNDESSNTKRKGVWKL
jgi:DNA-directed RNA polymerase alpha subunit